MEKKNCHRVPENKPAEVIFQFRDLRKVAELGSREAHLQEPIKPECFQGYDFNLLIFCMLFISSATILKTLVFILKQNQALETGRSQCLLMSLFQKKEGYFYLMILRNYGSCYEYALTRQVIPEPTSTPSVSLMDICVPENPVLKETSILPLKLMLSLMLS